jgi:hypothetical protein
MAKLNCGCECWCKRDSVQENTNIQRAEITIREEHFYYTTHTALDAEVIAGSSVISHTCKSFNENYIPLMACGLGESFELLFI